MAQPNVVREPSMDEILASIRRIIESNDPVPQPGLATGRSEPEGFVGTAANDDSEEVTLTVDDSFATEDAGDLYVEPAPRPVNVARLAPSAPAPATRDEPEAARQAISQPQRTLSLADVAARVRAASERGAAQRDSGFAETPVVRSDEPAATLKIEPPAEVVEEQPVQAKAVLHHESAVEQPVVADAQPVSLLSSSVGEQVARSFANLAVAVDDAERRSLDQMAEDMLRPMLQEWLDDNLPKLVERLVREEIERVARGVRR